MESQKYDKLIKWSKTKFGQHVGIISFIFEIMVVVLKEYEDQVKG